MYYFGAYVNLVDGDIWGVEAVSSSLTAPSFLYSLVFPFGKTHGLFRPCVCTEYKKRVFFMQNVRRISIHPHGTSYRFEVPNFHNSSLT